MNDGQRYLFSTGRTVICGAPTTLAVKGLMMVMMMMMFSVVWRCLIPDHSEQTELALHSVLWSTFAGADQSSSYSLC